MPTFFWRLCGHQLGVPKVGLVWQGLRIEGDDAILDSRVFELAISANAASDFS